MSGGATQKYSVCTVPEECMECRAREYLESIARRACPSCVRAFTAPSLPRRLRCSSGRCIVAIVGVTQGAGFLWLGGSVVPESSLEP